MNRRRDRCHPACSVLTIPREALSANPNFLEHTTFEDAANGCGGG